ncbi:MAG TPA: hypothetical protein VEV42_14850 [Pyrinomonadaceae bacterium]|jgi:hypothetical protein|nr:hypothetical protein [Pyrinomonadaceae bacterium]
MNYWLIENDKKSARVGDRLNNLQIQELPDGSYQLVGVGVMSITSAERVFENVPWQDHTWDIFLPRDLIVGENSKGHWHKHPDESDDTTDPKDGDYTAQAGSGLGEEPGKAASSANA